MPHQRTIQTPPALSTVKFDLLSDGRVVVMRQRKGEEYATATSLDEKETEEVTGLLKRLQMEF